MKSASKAISSGALAPGRAHLPNVWMCQRAIFEMPVSRHRNTPGCFRWGIRRQPSREEMIARIAASLARAMP